MPMHICIFLYMHMCSNYNTYPHSQFVKKVCLQYKTKKEKKKQKKHNKKKKNGCQIMSLC